MKNLLFMLLAIVIMAACSSGKKYDLVIRQVGFFDGEEDYGIVNIGINQDTIAAISKEQLSADSIIKGRANTSFPAWSSVMCTSPPKRT
ncbi:MAG: hypothetical protein P8100_15305 [bacterium]|jgi:uncharacterized protein YcfL